MCLKCFTKFQSYDNTQDCLVTNLQRKHEAEIKALQLKLTESDINLHKEYNKNVELNAAMCALATESKILRKSRDELSDRVKDLVKQNNEVHQNCPQQTLIEHLQRKHEQKIKALQSKYANLMGRNNELATSRDALVLSVNALESKRTNLKVALNAQLYAAVQQKAKFELVEQNNEVLSRDLQQARADLAQAVLALQVLGVKPEVWKSYEEPKEHKQARSLKDRVKSPEDSNHEQRITQLEQRVANLTSTPRGF